MKLYSNQDNRHKGGIFMKKRIVKLVSILLAALLLQGCLETKTSDKSENGKPESETVEKSTDTDKEETEKEPGKEEKETKAESEASDCLLLVNVNYESNILLAKYSIVVRLDGDEVATLSNGKEYFGSFQVKSGEHELTFEKNGDKDNCNSYVFNVENDCSVFCSLKSHMDHIEITEKNVSAEAVCPEGQHQWEDATCLSPKRCKVCGTTEGEKADHTPGTWQKTKEPTCTEEGEESCVCSVCGETITRKVDKIPHNVEHWDVVKEPTCTEEGEEKGVCTICGQETTRPVEKIPHDLQDWSVEKEAAFSESGVRVRKCKKCGEVVETEEYDLTEEERLKWLKKNCESGLYDAISRDPDMYKGKYVKFTGTVVQVVSEASGANDCSEYRIATKNGYDKVIFVLIDNYGKSRILEDDKITVYGRCSGLYSYKTVLGAKVTIPLIDVVYYE